MLRIICSQNIPKVAGRNYYIHLLAILNLAVLQKFRISVYIVCHLRNQTPDINRIGRRELISMFRQLFRQLFILKHCFHAALRIVKVPVNGNHIYILSFLRHHLQFLHSADAILGIEYNNSGPFYISKACQGSFARIAGCSSKNHNLVLCMVLLCRSGKKMGQNGQRHILKCNRRSVEQFQIIGVIYLHKGSDLFGIELTVIRLFYTLF